MSRYNSDLANDLGNLVSRLLNMGGRYAAGTVPAAEVEEAPEKELKALWATTEAELIPLFEDFQFHKALDRIFTFVSGINRYAETRAPWKLAKSEAAADQAALRTSLATMAEALRLAVVMLTPVMPEISDKIRGLVGADNFDRIEGQLEWGNTLEGKTLGEKAILFPRPERKA
jgi:methionyl-tRNA synthetase